jgi:hypothetical protein
VAKEREVVEKDDEMRGLGKAAGSGKDLAVSQHNWNQYLDSCDQNKIMKRGNRKEEDREGIGGGGYSCVVAYLQKRRNRKKRRREKMVRRTEEGVGKGDGK